MMTKMIANQPTRGDQLFLTKDFTQREPMILETLQAVPIYKGRLKLRFTLITKPSSDHHQRSKFCKLSFLSGSPMILGKMRWRRTLLAWAGLIQHPHHHHHPQHPPHHHNSHHLHHPHHTHSHHPHYIMDHQHPWQPLNDGSQHGKWNWKAELPVGQYSGKGQMMMMSMLTIMLDGDDEDNDGDSEDDDDNDE